MSIRMKFIAAAAAVLLAAIAVGSVVSNARVRSLERAVESARQQAKVNEEQAAAAEVRAAEYKAKIEYLQSGLEAIGGIARRQDEELEKIGGAVDGARGSVERSRRVRAIETNGKELCERLGELGHPC